MTQHRSRSTGITSRHLVLLVCFVASAVALFTGMPGRAVAADIVVNSLDDNAIDGGGFCTLREAITAANIDADSLDCVGSGVYGDGTITFSV